MADDKLTKFHRFDLNRMLNDIFNEELKIMNIVRNKYNIFKAIFGFEKIIYRSHRYTDISKLIINKKKFSTV